MGTDNLTLASHSLYKPPSLHFNHINISLIQCSSVSLPVFGEGKANERKVMTFKSSIGRGGYRVLENQNIQYNACIMQNHRNVEFSL